MPEGMKRIGYDADSGRYYFRDSDGTLWKGAEGVEFGEMTRGIWAALHLSSHSNSSPSSKLFT